MMAMGVLTNCLELSPQAAKHVGDLQCAPVDDASADGASLLVLLARTLRALLDKANVTKQHASQAVRGENEADEECEEAVAMREDAARQTMEREVSAAYVALLIGFICHHDPTHASTALAELREDSFKRVGVLLASYAASPSSAPLPAAHVL